MPLGTSELYLILRARDEASRVLSSFSRNFGTIDQAAMQSAQRQMQLGAAVTAVGAGMTAVGVIGAHYLKGAIDSAIEYRQEAAKTLTQVDRQGASLEEIEAIGRRVALAVPAPFKEMQTSLYDIFSSMDVNTKQAETLLKGFSQAAVGGQVSIQEAARATIGIMNAYRVPAEKVNEVNDFMFQLVRKGVGTYGEFAATIGRAVPSTVRAGQSYQTLGGMLAFMTRNGVSAAMAAASAGRAMDAFSHPKTIAHFAELGINVKNAAGEFRPMGEVMVDLSEKLKGLTAPERSKALHELFLGSGGTIQARRFFDMAIKNTGELTTRISEMNNAAGASQQAYDIMFKQPQSQLQLLNNQMAVGKTVLGDLLLPAFNAVLAKLIEVAQWFNNLSDSTKKWIAIGLVAGTAFMLIVGIMTMVAGVFIMLSAAAAMAGTSLAMVAGVGLLIIAALAAIGVAVYLAIKYWDEIKAAAMAAVDYLAKEVPKQFESLIEPIQTVWKSIREAADEFWKMLRGFFSDGMKMLKNEWAKWQELVKPVTEAAGHIKNLAKNLFDLLKFMFEVGLNAITVMWSLVWPILLHTLKPILDMIVSVVSAALRLIRNTIQLVLDIINGDWGKAWHDVLGILKAIWDAIYAVFKAAIGIVIGFFRGLIEGLISAARHLYDILVGHSIFPDLWDAIVAIFKNMIPKVVKMMADLPGQILKALGNLSHLLVSAGEDMIKGMMQGIKNMAGHLASAAKDAASSAVDGVKGFLHIGSPSKLMADQVGTPMMQGVAMGINDSMHLVEKAFASLTDLGAVGPTAAFDVGYGTGSSTNPSVVPVPTGTGGGKVVHLNFGPGSVVLSGTSEQGAREFVDQVTRMLGA